MSDTTKKLRNGEKDGFRLDQGTHQVRYLKFPSKQWDQVSLPSPAELRKSVVVPSPVGFPQENLDQKM